MLLLFGILMTNRMTASKFKSKRINLCLNLQVNLIFWLQLLWSKNVLVKNLDFLNGFHENAENF